VSLVRDLQDFSRDPAALLAWRDAIADALEK